MAARFGGSIGAVAISSQSIGDLRSFPGGDVLIGIGGETSTPSIISAKSTGLIASIQGGYNVSIGRGFIIGAIIEAGVPHVLAAASGQSGPCNYPRCRVVTSWSGIGNVQLPWSIALMGKAGFEVPTVGLVYLLAGWSVADAGFPILTPQVGRTQQQLQQALHGARMDAPTVGLGFEYAIGPDWAAKLEYRQTHYRDQHIDGLTSVSNCFAGDPCTASSSYSHSLRLQEFKIGIARYFH
jgi:opacity protein-like surface antigen